MCYCADSCGFCILRQSPATQARKSWIPVHFAHIPHDSDHYQYLPLDEIDNPGDTIRVFTSDSSISHHYFAAYSALVHIFADMFGIHSTGDHEARDCARDLPRGSEDFSLYRCILQGRRGPRPGTFRVERDRCQLSEVSTKKIGRRIKKA